MDMLNVDDLKYFTKRDPAAFPQFHRLIEKQYCHLPWPSAMKQVTIFNQERGGRGDIALAAKVIRCMQRMEPSLSFDWIVLTEKIDPQLFVHYFDPSKVKI